MPFPQKIDHEETKDTKEEQKKSSFSSWSILTLIRCVVGGRRALVVGIATHNNVVAANIQPEQEADQDRADD